MANLETKNAVWRCVFYFFYGESLEILIELVHYFIVFSYFCCFLVRQNENLELQKDSRGAPREKLRP